MSFENNNINKINKYPIIPCANGANILIMKNDIRRKNTIKFFLKYNLIRLFKII